jgi:DNA-binding MarR family transcriptional regulator
LKVPAGNEPVDVMVRVWAERVPGGDIDAKRLTLKLMLAGVAINRENESWCRHHFDLGRGEISVLMALRRAPHESMRPTDLFVSLSLSSAGVTKQLDALEKRGLIQRENHPGHRGGFLVRMTPSGRAIADAAHRGVDSAGPVASALGTLPRGQQREMEAALDILLEASYRGAQARKSRSRRQEAG